MNKSGFTLAEVLITLGLIGVVAAITLPALNTNIAEQRRVVYVKKAYNTLQTATKQLLVKEESMTVTEACGGSTITILQECYDKILQTDGEHKTKDGIEYVLRTGLPSSNVKGCTVGRFACRSIPIDIKINNSPAKDGDNVFRFAVDNKGEVVPLGSSLHRNVLAKSTKALVDPSTGKLSYALWATGYIIDTGKADYKLP